MFYASPLSSFKIFQHLARGACTGAEGTVSRLSASGMGCRVRLVVCSPLQGPRSELHVWKTEVLYSPSRTARRRGNIPSYMFFLGQHDFEASVTSPAPRLPHPRPQGYPRPPFEMRAVAVSIPSCRQVLLGRNREEKCVF